MFDASEEILFNLFDDILTKNPETSQFLGVNVADFFRLLEVDLKQNFVPRSEFEALKNQLEGLQSSINTMREHYNLY